MTDDIIQDAVAEAGKAHVEALEERLREAAADGYDYLYVVNDYATRPLLDGPFDTDDDRFGEAMTTTVRTKASNMDPEKLLPALDMHGAARAYDLSGLTDEEREEIADGEIPGRLWEQRRSSE